MSKIKLALDVVDDLRQLAASIETLAKAMQSKEDKTEEITVVPAEAATAKSEIITLEQVRAVLAAKSQSGKQPEVKALILKHGANKLTDLDPACYEELLKEAEEL